MKMKANLDPILGTFCHVFKFFCFHEPIRRGKSEWMINEMN